MSPFTAQVLQALQGIKHTAACDDSAPDESWNCICGRELRVADAVASMVNAAVDSTFTSCAVLGVRASDNTIAKARAAALRAASPTGSDNDGTSWDCPHCGTNVKGPSHAPPCPHCGKPEMLRVRAAPREPSPEAIRAFWERLGAFFDPWDTDERRVLEEALDAAYAVDGVPE